MAETYEIEKFIGAGAFAEVSELDYDEAGPDSEPYVAGKLVGQGSAADSAGFTIEFVNSGALPPWRSGAVSVAADGTFTTTLWAPAPRCCC